MKDQDRLFSLSLDNTGRAHLYDIAKWTRFLSIAGMIFLALAILASVLSITVLSGNQSNIENEELQLAVTAGTMIGVIMMMVIAFFPLFYLLDFSKKLKLALQGDDQEQLNLAWLNLKRFFRYIGIMLIIVLAVYGLVFVLSFLFAAVS